VEKPNEEKKLVGIEIVEKSIDVVGDDLVGKVAAEHKGKIGSLKLTLEGSLEFKPIAYSVIDFVEKKIPGDQTAFAAIAKAAVDKIKIKF